MASAFLAAFFAASNVIIFQMHVPPMTPILGSYQLLLFSLPAIGFALVSVYRVAVDFCRMKRS